MYQPVVPALGHRISALTVHSVAPCPKGREECHGLRSARRTSPGPPSGRVS
ncbi:hypothetical protein B005_2863 [Nocardiopsis alba ATCC BAA-2165]|uniref:Uncharacterized protein n=1 Tax=Nocardiopsis alba (strain ATCC BAA-2165 / BE74) TaxID=1205910 RepID=J7LE52_NOCAA|nr:hypothetical protein B005_2863 [Nocardiopsis alba ATCC BAA-2165]